MTVFFVDTSALAKRYLQEVGSEWVTEWTEPSAGHVILISQLTIVEMYSLLARRARLSEISTEDRDILQGQFMLHVHAEYVPVLLDNEVLLQSQILLNQFSLRSLDALQAASALRAMKILGEPLTFVAADDRLTEVANALGFPVDNPNNHI